jgi:hypothetical protein
MALETADHELHLGRNGGDGGSGVFMGIVDMGLAKLIGLIMK